MSSVERVLDSNIPDRFPAWPEFPPWILMPPRDIRRCVGIPATGGEADVGSDGPVASDNLTRRIEPPDY